MVLYCTVQLFGNCILHVTSELKISIFRHPISLTPTPTKPSEMRKRKRNPSTEVSEGDCVKQCETEQKKFEIAIQRRLATAGKKDTSEVKEEEVDDQADNYARLVVEEMPLTMILEVVRYRCLNDLGKLELAESEFKKARVEHRNVVQRSSLNVKLMRIAMKQVVATDGGTDVEDVKFDNDERLKRQAFVSIESELRKKEDAMTEAKRVDKMMMEILMVTKRLKLVDFERLLNLSLDLEKLKQSITKV